jgi:hypothetical protein
MSSRTQAQPVWVDLAALFRQADSPTDGTAGRTVIDGTADDIDVSRPAPGGLTRWLRTSADGWVGMINVVVTMTDGSTIKLADQLVPAHALRPR